MIPVVCAELRDEFEETVQHQVGQHLAVLIALGPDEPAAEAEAVAVAEEEEAEPRRWWWGRRRKRRRR